MGLLEQYTSKQKELKEQIEAKTLKLNYLPVYQEINYRIFVLKTIEGFCKTAPITLDKKALTFSFTMAQKLYDMGIRADFDKVGRSLKAQMKYADKTGAKFVAVIGETEIETGEIKLKSMADSTETTVKLDAEAIAKVISK